MLASLMRHVITVAVYTIFLSSLARAQSSLNLTVSGTGANESFGAEVAAAGDVNADGIPDFLVGAPHAGLGGQARVFSGLDGGVIHTVSGTAAGDMFGTVAGIGDINNDGHDDFAVGAPLADTATLVDAGSLTIFSGLDASILFHVTGTRATAQLGRSVAGGGDVNGDLVPDVLVNDRAVSTISDQVLAISGLDGSVAGIYTSFVPGVGFAADFDFAGDVNGDGMTDLVVGSPGDDPLFPVLNTGSTTILSGASGNIIHYINASFTGNGGFGEAVAGVGDVDGDGIDDVAVGAPRDNASPSPSGSVRVFSGANGALIHYFPGFNNFDSFGAAVDGAGDVNGDGFADILVGQPSSQALAVNSGRAVIYSGRDGSELTRAESASLIDGFGSSLASVGDLNEDGYPDFLVGAPVDDAGEMPTVLSRAQVFHVPTFPTLKYDSDVNAGTTLDLSWTPNGSDEQAVLGTILCTGGSPGGIGLFGVSLAIADFQLTFGFPLLIGNDPSSLLILGSFGFDVSGTLQVPNTSRQNPFIAGSQLFIQMYEFAPVVAASNGLRLLVSP